MSIERSKALSEMFRQGKIPVEPFVCIDALNGTVVRDVFCTIKATIGKSNMHFITLITDD